ncbi:hypothetical protein SODALDRAFT_306203 [Sodiomyces alkalinus F11]|uniref:Potassium transport protein n=1 Tax=Sodiomyces alkalinus (strain CBS 110278 / VKM F-3762 / F11) TaxID=1314773 RepID=A0A3N2Q0N5_SODAK|nr:hypothetical protein SODALDRAFT_306203 [Sodiomyces alkalinus F11]ROT40175.1 hypothetical protein SODALDRAFT_306203 [Sodiomyces alkalinus F11]
MFRKAYAWLLRQLHAAKPSIPSKKPHFNFIWAHYSWIVGMTILASILIYATSEGQLHYIDALFFASGANTQAGLNTVNVNKLNTFQQVCIYIFMMTSNPITVHSFVVFLRLYWFEKFLRRMVRNARARRASIPKSRTRSFSSIRDGRNLAEAGVAGRSITMMPNSGTRIPNEDMVFKPNPSDDGQDSNENETSKPTTVEPPSEGPHSAEAQSPHHATQITFSHTVTRSDGLSTALAKLSPPQSSHDNRVAIRPRRGSQEVLRIPNPRDAELGIKPMPVEDGHAAESEDEADEQNSHLGGSEGAGIRANAHSGGTAARQRQQQTITIAEPPRPPNHASQAGRQDHSESQPASRNGTGGKWSHELSILWNVLEPLRFRKPRIFQSGNRTYHATGDDEEAGRDVPRPHQRARRPTFDAIKGIVSRGQVDDAPYLSWSPTIGRNSQFLELSEEQREELGGIEYRSLRILALILAVYFWGFWLFSLVCLVPWIRSSANESYAKVVEAAGASRTWWGLFTANSAYLDVGFTLTPDSMISFNQSRYVLMMMAFVIIIGNTGFPIMLRAIIWVMARLVPRDSGVWEELRFLLDHPRRCFTLLFPTAATWWLFWILVSLNAIDLLFFVVLDLNEPAVNELPVNTRIVNGIFQAACTRTAGFSSISISALHPAVQVSYMIMMYISVFPIAMSIRRTNVYEERSLGIYGSGEDDGTGDESSGLSFIGTHLRRQLSFDLWYVSLGLFVLTITEGSKIKRNEFNVYSLLFEIISAYGTVGLSLGYPGVDMSLSSQFSTVGKLVIIAMQIRGRHRGLPYALDRAVLLPSEDHFKAEGQELQQVLSRQMSTATARSRTAAAAATGVDVGRGRSMHRGLISSIFHPGPPMSRDPRTRSRRRSPDGEGDRPDGGGLQRRHTEPADTAELGPYDEPHVRARRIVTTPVHSN